MSTFNEWYRRRRQDAVYKAREWLDRWRALPRKDQARIAGGLLVLAAMSLSLAVYFTFDGTAVATEGAGTEAVVLYTSVDSFLVEPIIKEFEATTGITVKVVTDTEATKNTGLIERLLAEAARPRADVWWSSEPMGTVMLANASVLEPFASKSESDFPRGWPAHLRPADRTWYGFAQRARVVAFNTNRLTRSQVPTRLRDLTGEEWRDKVGMARPQFGTTRTHIASLVATCGVPETREWLTAMKANGLRLYDGNSAVVQALSVGEIEIGLTDTDDVWAAKRNTWPVDMVYEVADKPGAKVEGLCATGPIVLPNTVAKVRGGPHPNEAGRLADFLLSARVEAMLAESDSKNIPIRPALAEAAEVKAPPSPAELNPDALAAAVPIADRLINELFGFE